jgi:hypothetical protein
MKAEVADPFRGRDDDIKKEGSSGLGATGSRDFLVENKSWSFRSNPGPLESLNPGQRFLDSLQEGLCYFIAGKSNATHSED